MTFHLTNNKSITFHRDNNTCLLKYANQNRNENFFNDVIIKTDDQNISANRMVLSCFSQYFEKMFKSKMKEQYENIVEVKGVDGKSMQILVDYIYNGQIDINGENVMSLLAGADYLQLIDVKQFCFDYLEIEITSENCFDVLHMVNLYTNDKLLDKVQHFIGENFEEVSKKSDFLDLIKPDLVLCISSANCFPTRFNIVCKSILQWVKHDRQTRKDKLADLIKLIDLRTVTTSCLENLVDDDLVQKDLLCTNYLNWCLLKVLKDCGTSINQTKIMSVGGRFTATKVIEAYSLSEQTNVVVYPKMPTPVKRHRLLKLKKYIYYIGGEWNNHPTDACWRLDLNSKIWEKVASMNETRTRFAAAEFDNTLVVVGGYNDIHGRLRSVEAYFSSIDEWVDISPLNQSRYRAELVVCNDSIFAIGGLNKNQQILRTVERLCCLKNTWEFVSPMKTSRYCFAAVNFEGFIYVIGGSNWSSKLLNDVEKFDPRSDKWSTVSSLNIKRYCHCACVLQGKIFVIGGSGEGDKPIQEIECYIPSRDKWIIVGRTKEKLDDHAIVVI